MTPPPQIAGATISSPPFAATHSRARDYYELTKPRMNFLVLATTAVGYYMAVEPGDGFARLVPTLVGTALTAASASVLNQYVERDIDILMPRTADRPLPGRRIAPSDALRMGLVMGVFGVACLALFVNALTAVLGLFTLASYVLIYTPLKRTSTLNTVVGAVPGAIPPVMGFTAVQNGMSPEALCLFAILFLWQMPHFLAIAILYKKDYAMGGFKMLPVVDETLALTGRQIVVYSLALIPATLLPVGLHMAGHAYFAGALLMGLAFLTFGISCAASRTRLDARKLFFASILYLPLLLGLMMFDKVHL